MSKCVAITLSWNPYLERWIAKDILGRNLYEFPDCGWFWQLFGELDKGSKHAVVVTSEIKPT